MPINIPNKITDIKRSVTIIDVLLYLYLSITCHINCIITRSPDRRWLSHGMCLYQAMMTLHFLNDVANDAESTQKSKDYAINPSLKSETMGKLINRIPGPCLLISSFTGSAANKRFKALPGKLLTKDTHLVFSMYPGRIRCFEGLHVWVRQTNIARGNLQNWC